MDSSGMSPLPEWQDGTFQSTCHRPAIFSQVSCSHQAVAGQLEEVLNWLRSLHSETYHHYHMINYTRFRRQKKRLLGSPLLHHTRKVIRYELNIS